MNIHSYRQKLTVNELSDKGLIKQEIQSYDILDQRPYQGTMTVLKMLLEEGLIKSDLQIVVNRKRHEDGPVESETSEDEADQEAKGDSKHEVVLSQADE